MKLSSFSDYSLRVLMYLGTIRERLVTIGEIAAAHDISEAHLMKVVHHLGRCGYIETVRGKGGGMQLRRPPQEIVLGDVIRKTESTLCFAECDAPAAPCRLGGICRLRGIFDAALGAMLVVLDSHTLADVLGAPGERALPLRDGI